MQTIQLKLDALEVKSFVTTQVEAPQNAPTYITSAVSETDGVVNCKSCGPCCN
jgi:hypothetical protein